MHWSALLPYMYYRYPIPGTANMYLWRLFSWLIWSLALAWQYESIPIVSILEVSTWASSRHRNPEMQGSSGVLVLSTKNLWSFPESCWFLLTFSLLLWFSNLCEICCFFLSSFLTTVAVYVAQLNTLVDLDYAKYEESINNQIGNIEFLEVQYPTPLIGEPTETIGNSMNVLFWCFLYQFRWLYRWAVFEITFRGGYTAGSTFVFPPNDLIHNVNKGVLAMVNIDW